ncbi:CRTAC1 family protein [Halosimplex litoreum]|uniref:CRTAC1 family protein n=1 Tax=Halosimplex litoreum TaxID=1198301 RepID=A0A7T3FWM1_9EURY|nr:CRTAC1 family protein [Halosimplex litoreum]QPV62046.1 CRTAC1 family protein [Halosimplex litoreum]
MTGSDRRTSGAAHRALLTVAVALTLVVSGCAAAPGSLDGAETDGASAEIGFVDATAEAGLAYNGTGTGAAGNGNNGVFVADIDNDGWEDLLAVGGEHPALFRNTGGAFERTGELSGLEREYKSAAFVDYDGDGWRDLLLLAKDGPAAAFHNDEGSFERTDVGLGNFTHPLGAAAADYDGDGDRDLFVYQSGDWADERPEGYFSTNKSVAGDNGNPNVLFENTGESGEGRFERVDGTGITGDRWTLAASFVDLTGDGRPDIHAANDYNNDTVYLNRGDGTFEQVQLGGATARNGMASEINDVNRDGRPDVFVTNIDIPASRETLSPDRYERLKRFLQYVIHSGRTKGNTMLINQGDGEFVDRADAYGVREGGWGWAASVTDLDNDGDRDLFHTTQTVVALNQSDPVFTLPMVWERDGDNFTRLDASDRGFAEQDGRGMVTVDYDRDGDRDVIIADYHGPYAVYENTVRSPDTERRANGSAPAGAAQFEIVDGNGAVAVGANATVTVDGRETAVWQNSRSDFISQESSVTHIGLGDAERATVDVTWPDGTERTVELDADRRYRIGPDGVDVVANFSAAPAN